MQGNRLKRVGHLIQMELGRLILNKVRDPRVGMVTVTHVNVAADLRSARVFYSVFGEDQQKKDTQKALEKAAGFLQRELGSVIEMRFTPKLTFVLDTTLNHGMEIDRILRDLKKDANT